MITGISIENFKGISERVTLDLRPITLLFGANSAGKSTILHALHYAREVFERHNLDADQTIAGGKYIDLGGFSRFVHGHQSDRVVCMSFELEVSEKDLPTFNADFDVINRLTEYRVSSIASGITSATIEISISWSHLENCAFVNLLKVALNKIPFAEISAQPNLRETVLKFVDFFHPCLTDMSDDDGELVPIAHPPTPGNSVLAWLLDASSVDSYVVGDETVFPLKGRCDALPNLNEDLDFDTELVSPQKTGVLWELARAISSIILGPCLLIRDHLQAFRYLGPLRETPPGAYFPPRFPEAARWASGLGAWDSLYNGPVKLIDSVGLWLGDADHLNAGCTLERRWHLELDLAHPIVRKLLNRHAFDDLDEGEGLDLSRVPLTSRIVILAANSDAELRPHEVGIGISQVVPVIVTALDGEQRLLAIEQPELHIHPRLQAALADLFIESIHTNKHCFIIETHSEHLILRLLRRIRET